MSCAECTKFLFRLIPCSMRTRQDWTQSAASATCTWRDINQHTMTGSRRGLFASCSSRFFLLHRESGFSSLWSALEPTLAEQWKTCAQWHRQISIITHVDFYCLSILFPGASLQGIVARLCHRLRREVWNFLIFRSRCVIRNVDSLARSHIGCGFNVKREELHKIILTANRAWWKPFPWKVIRRRLK